MNFEQFVFSYELSDHLIDCVVEFHELVSFVVFVGENVLLYVHSHIEKKFEKKLTDSEILAYHLTFLYWEDVLHLGLFMRALF